MTTTAGVFEDGLAAFKAEQSAPWGRLRYGIAAANLRRHLPPGNLHILDAGGGNGPASVPLAVQGHQITLLDYSSEMLAEARRDAEASGVTERFTFVQADVAAIPSLFPEASFDLVLCYNVIQYVDDPTAVLAAVYRALKPGGLLSLMCVNRHSEPYRQTYRNIDPAAACASLDAAQAKVVLFGVMARLYTVEEMRQALEGVGYEIVADYGVRCVCDYILDNEIKYDSAFFAHLERLESALTDRYPFKLLARFLQVIARR